MLAGKTYLSERIYNHVLEPNVTLTYSPNTPGLRSLQNKEELAKLLSGINKTLNDLSGKRPPLLLKLAPDLSLEEMKDVVSVISKKDTRVDGLIISNTTIDRSSLVNQEHSNEAGGLSGKPLTNKSTEMIKTMYKLTKGITKLFVYEKYFYLDY